MNSFQWLSGVEPLIKQAGKRLLSFYGQDLVRKYKKQQGLVTDADLAIEEYLMTHLPQVQPEASFITEESGNSGDNNSEWKWVIDPIDGTTNFAYGLPYFCISVALTQKNSPVMGAVYNPLLDQFFYAEKAKGTWLNGKKVGVSQPESFNRALINIGVPYRKSDWKDLVPIVEQVTKQAYAIRHFGAIALDLAHVAAGNLDGVLFFRLSWWDVAAGILLVQESGGLVTDFKGQKIAPDYHTCIAGGKLVYESLTKIVS